MISRKPIRVVQYGLGAIGVATARLVQSKNSLKLVGAVEIEPSRADLQGLAVPIHPSLSGLLRQAKADIVLHTTSSRLAAVTPQLLEIAKARLPCISSSEELFCPRGKNRILAQKINQTAQKYGVTVVGTGVNPGFVMDVLPVLFTHTCQHVQRVTIQRIVDVSTRRVQLQRKVGIGLSRKEFDRLRREGKMGHVGLRESAGFVAEALGWKLDSIRHILAPISTKSKISGIREQILGTVKGRTVLRLELVMAAGAENPRDEIRIEGEPPARVILPGGIHGDQATAAILVNTIPLALNAGPGLQSALELGLPRMFQ